MIFVILQVAGLIVASVVLFLLSVLLIGINIKPKWLNEILSYASMFLISISVQALFFAGWIVVYNIFSLHDSKTFQSSFRTPHFLIYFIGVLLLIKPFSILMGKSFNLICKWQCRLKDN